MLRGDFTVDFQGATRQIIPHTTLEEKWKVTIVDTGLNTETGARIKRIEPYIANDLFLLTYGDGVANVDLNALMRFHKEQAKIATVTGVHPTARFGEIAVENALAVYFGGKTQVQQGYIDGGFFVLHRNIFPYLKEDESFNFEKDVLPVLAKEHQLAVFRHEGYWQCMDTPRDMEVLQEEWQKGKAPWKIWGT